MFVQRVEQEQHELIEQQAQELARCKQQLLETQKSQEEGRKHLATELMKGIGALVEDQVTEQHI